ncbi:MAG: amidohydrolase family protein, partial [Lachnospiraceae bacterium]|nr:amidohydrolase family protein [Lachnospiraceae bacterium]
TSYSWKTLLNKGLSVSNGSDCPVELPDVMAGIRCAVTRCSLDGTGPYLPDQAFTVQEALDSFTVSGARVSFEETVKGAVQPGMLADFVVLGGDPFETPAEELHRVAVEEVWLGGRRLI